MYSGVKMLITGGTGSLGYALTKRFLDEGAAVRIFSRDEKKQYDMQKVFPQCEYRLGDVRDKVAIRDAVRDVEVIIHAASLKYVNISELQPSEYITTNVAGSMNLIDAVLQEQTVQHCVGISSDKACLDGGARVALADGTTKFIREIVKDKLEVEVLTLLPDNTVGTSRVTNWYKNKLQGRRKFRISFKNAPGNGRGTQQGVWVTEDHPIFTTRGWVEARDIKSEDELITSIPAPNHRQMAFICGTLLGDSSIGRNKKSNAITDEPFHSVHIRLGHAEDEYEWLSINRIVLESLGANSIRKDASLDESTQNFYSFSFSAPWMKPLQKSFYPGNIKVVPKELIEECFSLELLAAWYMDDGCISDGAARFATHSFSKEDVQWLAELMTIKGFNAYVQELNPKGYGPYYELRLKVDGSNKLFELIGRFITPSMRHKIPEWAPKYNPSSWDLGDPIAFIDQVVVVEDSPCDTCGRTQMQKADVYCLDVEDTHNFIVNGVVVHNCLPVNAYGLTKALLEKVFLEASKRQGEKGSTIFNVARYGNVVGTRGSVVPFWKERCDQGLTLPITNPEMTRFFFTLQEAVNLIEYTLTQRAGVITSKRMRACTLGDLAAVMQGDAGVEITGERPGEKKHELLLSEDEMARTTQCGDYFVYDPSAPVGVGAEAYGSLIAPRLSGDQISELIDGL